MCYCGYYGYYVVFQIDEINNENIENNWWKLTKGPNAAGGIRTHDFQISQISGAPLMLPNPMSLAP
jgi:hypothetical protein